MATKNSAGGFKQMPKMMTDEPSVILKLKKGGHVNTKHLEKGEHGHAPMSSGAKYRESMEADEGESPKKPSMSERKKAMNPNFKNGGKAKMADGGMMANPQAMAAMANPAVRAAMAKRAMAKRAMAAPMAAPAMGAPMNAPMGGGLQPGMKKGGKAGDMAQDKAMIKKAFKEHDAQEHKGGKGTKIKLKDGGAIQGGEGKYAKTMMHDGDKTNSAKGTGGVKMAKPAGYAAGGTISGNEGKYVKTKVVDGDKTDIAKGTGGVRMGNAGGYAKGGTVPEGDWEHRLADTAKPGVTNATTGGVKNGNGGGYKMGGKASKKAYATGGSVNDAGKPVAYPVRPRARPVVNTAQSGTFKHGGKVKMADGGSTGDAVIDREQARRKNEQATTKSENENQRNQILGVPRAIYSGVKNFINDNFAPSGSYGRTEKDVAPAEAKKRGGSAKC
jgi:hypothetical protein